MGRVSFHIGSLIAEAIESGFRLRPAERNLAPREARRRGLCLHGAGFWGEKMDRPTSNRALIALVDDDVHCARMLLRTLGTFGVDDARWLGGAERSERLIETMYRQAPSALPGVVLVDLKTNSSATAAFIAAIGEIANSADILVVAIAPSPDETMRKALRDAGADAVFERHADFDAYRQEAASIARYWARSARLEATGS